MKGPAVDHLVFRRIVFWVTTVGFAIHILNLLIEPASSPMLTAIDGVVSLALYLGVTWAAKAGRLDRFMPGRDSSP